jgi:hypothetical protein
VVQVLFKAVERYGRQVMYSNFYQQKRETDGRGLEYVYVTRFRATKPTSLLCEVAPTYILEHLARENKMTIPEPLAYGVLIAYFGLIALSFGFVFSSILSGVKVGKLFEGRPFLFLRTAIGGLLCTWYCQLWTSQKALH